MSNMKIILFMYKSLHCLTTYCSMYYYVQKKRMALRISRIYNHSLFDYNLNRISLELKMNGGSQNEKDVSGLSVVHAHIQP